MTGGHDGQKSQQGTEQQGNRTGLGTGFPGFILFAGTYFPGYKSEKTDPDGGNDTADEPVHRTSGSDGGSGR